MREVLGLSIRQRFCWEREDAMSSVRAALIATAVAVLGIFIISNTVPQRPHTATFPPIDIIIWPSRG